MNCLSSLLRRLFGAQDKTSETNVSNMRYLVVGLGNVGAEYDGTRHNIGFRVADALARALHVEAWEDRRYGFVAKGRVKNAELILLKPSTYMNLSGKAVHYWMEKENIPLERLLVVCDDLSLPFGKIRLRSAGSDGGHNGLKNIAQLIGTQAYARLRFGIGNEFARGQQVDFVLGRFSDEDLAAMDERVQYAVDAVKTFCLAGINVAMNQFNKK